MEKINQKLGQFTQRTLNVKQSPKNQKQDFKLPGYGETLWHGLFGRENEDFFDLVKNKNRQTINSMSLGDQIIKSIEIGDVNWLTRLMKNVKS